MKRKFEIIDESEKYYRECLFDVDRSDIQEAFVQGAQWADKTIIEKAHQWFNLHFRQLCVPKEIKHDFESKERMWKSFTQFMKE